MKTIIISRNMIHKNRILFSITVILSFALSAPDSLARSSVSDYTVVYSTGSEYEEGEGIALQVGKLISDATGCKLAVAPDTQFKGRKAINIINSGRQDLFCYEVKTVSGRITIDGGGVWAMLKGGRLLAEQLKNGSVPSSWKTSGTVEGEFLFPRAEDSNLRILDDNIWDYSAETIPEAWQKLGVDCRDSVRAPQFAQLVRAYMPDVLNLQEYSTHMHRMFYPIIEKYGYVIAYESGADWNNTPVFYNRETVELVNVNFNLYTPSRWSNHGSKSYTSAVFRHKATGRLFAVINTHLWWKGEKAQAGSNDARAAQAYLMMAESDILRSKHNAPVVITGDMNTYEDSLPIQTFINGGYVPCYKAATQYADNHNGHHICGPADGFDRKSRRRSPEREKGAIDHCLIYGNAGAEVKVFDCIMTAFTVKLTDHYPNLIDLKL